MYNQHSKFSRDAILSAIGLQTRRSAASMVLPTLGVLTAGIVVGGGIALLLAPKTGAQTRQVIGGSINGLAKRVAWSVRPSKRPIDDGLEVTPRNEEGGNSHPPDLSRSRAGMSPKLDLNAPKV